MEFYKSYTYWHFNIVARNVNIDLMRQFCVLNAVTFESSWQIWEYYWIRSREKRTTWNYQQQMEIFLCPHDTDSQIFYILQLFTFVFQVKHSRPSTIIYGMTRALWLSCFFARAKWEYKDPLVSLLFISSLSSIHSVPLYNRNRLKKTKRYLFPWMKGGFYKIK